MTLNDLRRERDEVGIGQEILLVVADVSRAVVRSYDPTVYGGEASWGAGLEDLVQEVVLDRLLRERQLDYALTVASSTEDFRRLMTRQVKRTLAHRRRKSVIDNLIGRALPILDGEGFATRGDGSQRRFWLANADVLDREPADTEVYEAAVAAAVIPKTPSHGLERAPVVYSPAALQALILVVAETLSTELSVPTLDRVLRLVLTDWVASDLVDSREAEYLPAAGALGPEEAAQVDAVVTDILQQLPAGSLPVLRFKYAGLSDQEIGGRLNLSRPTVAKRKELALTLLRQHLSDESEPVREAVVSELGLRIARAT